MFGNFYFLELFFLESIKLYFLYCYCFSKFYCKLPVNSFVGLASDTAAKLQVTKQKAGKANDTALEVLARLKDMNQNLMGLNRNYSKLKDDINKANNLIRDPEKNSTSFF